MTTETPEWVKRAKVGDKVVCVEGDYAGRLEKGQTYTIKRVFEGYDAARTICIGFEILETEPINPRHEGFFWSFFKPLETRKTDISIFTEMLKTKELEKC